MHLGHAQKTQRHTQRNQVPNEQSNPQHNTAKLDVGLLLLERAGTSLNLTVFLLKIDLTSSRFS
jgi:hypothetical protein